VLIRDLILILTNKGDIILDPFSGSGTTPVACINTGRNCIAIEKDEKYYNIEIERCKQAEKDKKYNLFQEGDLK
jgi:DNA modification methylase